MTASIETSLEALPYKAVPRPHDRDQVRRAAMRDEELREAFARDVVLLKYVGEPGDRPRGGPEITDYMERLGMEVKFVKGQRVSDAETVEVAKMVLLGKINSDILVRLNRHGQRAVGLGGEDGSLFEVRPVEHSADVGFVGEIEKVNVDVIDHIAEDYVPVIASVGTDRDGASYNVNATRPPARWPPRCPRTRRSSSPMSTVGCGTRTILIEDLAGDRGRGPRRAR